MLTNSLPERKWFFKHKKPAMKMEIPPNSTRSDRADARSAKGFRPATERTEKMVAHPLTDWLG
jgi:hypothetical protein